jgi:hypothetical protein
MRPVGIAPEFGERALDAKQRRRDLADLDQGKGMGALKPPVVPVGSGEGLKKGEQFSLAAGAAAEADQPEHAGAGCEHHGIARIALEVLLRRGKPGSTAAIDECRQRGNVAPFAVWQCRRQGARLPRRGLGRIYLTAYLQGARKGRVRDRKPGVAGGGAAKLLLRAVVGGKREIDTGKISVPRLGRRRAQRVAIAILHAAARRDPSVRPGGQSRMAPWGRRVCPRRALA